MNRNKSYPLPSLLISLFLVVMIWLSSLPPGDTTLASPSSPAEVHLRAVPFSPGNTSDGVGNSGVSISSGTYPGDRPGIQWVWVKKAETDRTLSVEVVIEYPSPFVTFVSATPGDYMSSCTHDDAEHKIHCTGTVPQLSPAQDVTGTLTTIFESTCELFTDPQTQLDFKGWVGFGDGTWNTTHVNFAVAPVPDLNMIADSPADGARNVPIESSGQGPLLKWHPPQELACSIWPLPDLFDTYYEVELRKQGGSWRAIGGWGNCDLQIQLTPSDLSCQENGDPATWEWRVKAYDYKYGSCHENPVETVFRFTTASCRPELTKIETDYGYSFFLHNIHVNNRCRVEVDWNGPAYESPPPAPYGQVHFEVNGNDTAVDGQDWGAEHTFDMGNDFNADWYGGHNVLRIWATYRPSWASCDIRSEYHTVQPVVYPFPEWATTFNLGPFAVNLKEGTVEYENEVSYPEEPFEANVTVPKIVPYLGGKRLGILETQATGSIKASSAGRGKLGLTGRTGLGMGGFDVVGEVGGEGKFAFLNGDGLKLTNSSLFLAISTPFRKEATLGDLIPGLRAMENWKIIGKIVRKINRLVRVTGELIPRVSITANFRQVGHDRWVFEGSVGRGEIQMNVRAEVKPFKKVWVAVYGGGTPYVELNFPANPDYLREVGIDLSIGAEVRLWRLEKKFEYAITCSLPQGSCREKEEEDLLFALAQSDPSSWSLMERDYITPAYATFVANNAPHHMQHATHSASTTETPLITNIYPLAEPSLAVRADGHRTLLYIHDDPDKPLGQGEELYVTQWNGVSWSNPISLTNDLQMDFSPQVVYDGNGNAVAVWERTYTDVITSGLTVTFARQIDIGAATWFSNTGSWSGVTMLTNDNGLLDFAPRLRAGYDGSVLALWETNDGEDIMGSADHPITYTYATWNGTAWSTPAPALTALTSTLDMDVAVHSASKAALVYTVDTDGLLTTTADTELFYSSYDGSTWSAPIRLTNDTITDTSPALVYDADGTLKIVWRRGDALVMLDGSLDVDDAQVVRPDSTAAGFLDFALARSPQGHLALVWQEAHDDLVDLAYSVYDVSAGRWGATQHLMEDDDLEVAFAPTFAADGTLYLSYLKTETEYVTETVPISPTLSVTVTNIPQPGQSDLYLLSHTIGRDLTMRDLTITPTYPAAGEAVTLTAQVGNVGDLEAGPVVVRFSDGGTTIAQVTVAPTLTAGTWTTATVSWTAPDPIIGPHTLQATVDPAGSIAETDETNNTVTLTALEPHLVAEWATRAHSPTTLTYTLYLTNAGSSPASAPITVSLRAGDLFTGPVVATGLISSDVLAGERTSATVVVEDPASLSGMGDEGWLVAGEPEADYTNAWPVALGAQPDLTLTPGDVVGNGPFTVTVHNVGVITATDVALAVWRGSLSGSLVYKSTVGDIGPGEVKTATFNFAYPEGSWELWLKADPDDLIAESDETNNLAVWEHTRFSRIYLPVVLKNYSP